VEIRRAITIRPDRMWAVRLLMDGARSDVAGVNWGPRSGDVRIEFDSRILNRHR
jgi:hypothetical protein